MITFYGMTREINKESKSKVGEQRFKSYALKVQNQLSLKSHQLGLS